MDSIFNAVHLEHLSLYSELEIFLGFFWKLKVSDMITEISPITLLVKESIWDLDD